MIILVCISREEWRKENYVHVYVLLEQRLFLIIHPPLLPSLLPPIPGAVSRARKACLWPT